jgi:hypothetical protein
MMSAMAALLGSFGVYICCWWQKAVWTLQPCMFKMSLTSSFICIPGHVRITSYTVVYCRSMYGGDQAYIASYR